MVERTNSCKVSFDRHRHTMAGLDIHIPRYISKQMIQVLKKKMSLLCQEEHSGQRHGHSEGLGLDLISDPT